MNNATHGSYVTTPQNTMRAYDALPEAVREAVRNAIADWATQPLRTSIRKGESANELVERLILDDMDACRSDAKKDWGAQASDFLAAQPPRLYGDWFDRPPKGRPLTRHGVPRSNRRPKS